MVCEVLQGACVWWSYAEPQARGDKVSTLLGLVEGVEMQMR